MKTEEFISKYELKSFKGALIEPGKLISSNRLDVIIKLIYLIYRDLCPDLAANIYRDHIDILTQGKFTEYGNANKNSYEKFINSFEEIFNNIKDNGFKKDISVLPVSESNTILNGAHRLACCLYLNKKVFYKKFKLPNHPYDYSYFKLRGFNKTYLDFSIYNYIINSENTFVALIWPSANKNVDPKKFFKDVVYEKTFTLSPNGAHNFLAQVYKEHSWLGDFENGYGGAITKLSQSFKNFSPVRAIYFNANSLNEVLKLKEDIREFYGIEKASIHINDTKKEIIELSQYILNDNSIHFLNNSKPYTYKSLYNYLKEFNNTLIKEKINPNDIVIDGGLVMSLYGLRESNDVDYISKKKLKNKYGDNHISELKYHNVSLENLIYDPKYHFYFNGLKFISIEQLCVMKKNRNETKDQLDVMLINGVKRNKNFVLLSIKNSFQKIKIQLIAFLIPFTKKIKIYSFAKWIYKKLK